VGSNHVNNIPMRTIRPRTITVLGCGVSGLTTAVSLLEAGHEVRILARELPEGTVSAVAAAIWFPYEAEPREQVNRWSAESFAVFAELTAQPGTGVAMTDFLVLSQPGQDDSWKDHLPAGAVRQARPDEMPTGFTLGYLARVPLVETPRYLPYLLARFQNQGGTIELREIQTIDNLLKTGELLVNCSGLGARQLFDDDTLYPIRGQVLRAAKTGPLRSMVYSREKGRLAYIIARSSDVVLGGTDYEHDYREAPTEEDSRAILERCRALEPRLGQPVVLGATAGLRPKRPLIRCEWEAERPIIHNYGHGGAGFTVSWGCAQEVCRLVDMRW
jgi:D-amino-acid oxidase